MELLYTSEYLNKIKGQKRLNLIVVLSLIAVMLIINAVLIIVFAGMPFGSGLKPYFILASSVSTVILTFIICMYYQIIYAPIKSYYLKILEILSGKRFNDTVTVLRVNDYPSDKLGVEFTSFDVLVWSDTQNDYVERTVLVDANFKLDIVENQMVTMVTCGNILLSYEVK